MRLSLRTLPELKCDLSQIGPTIGRESDAQVERVNTGMVGDVDGLFQLIA